MHYRLQFWHEEDSYNNVRNKNLLMPKAAIFFSILLLSSFSTNSYAFTGDSVYLQDEHQKIDFSSNILDVDQNFFVENDFKRYLIFGANSQYSNFIKNNSLYGVQSNHGFFYVSLLSEKSEIGRAHV